MWGLLIGSFGVGAFLAPLLQTPSSRADSGSFGRT